MYPSMRSDSRSPAASPDRRGSRRMAAVLCRHAARSAPAGI